jgi:hypothetical protein
MSDDVRPWKCESGHVLGQVRRNGSNVRQLWLYRHAVDPATVDPANVDVLATVDGLVMDVRCDVCGAIRTWTPGEESLKRLLAHMQGR